MNYDEGLIITKQGDLQMKKPSKKSSVYRLCLTALFAALTACLTIFPKIYIPGTTSGYVHLGDTIILLCACILPLPYAMAAGAIGGLLADIISGVPIWAPFTFVIKALMIVAFSSKSEKIITKRNSLANILYFVVTIGGYFFATWILYSYESAVATNIWSLIQCVPSTALWFIIGAVFDKINIKSKLKFIN